MGRREKRKESSLLQKPDTSHHSRRPVLSKSSVRAVGCRSWSGTRRRDLLEHSPFTTACATALSDSESSRVWPSGHAAKVSSLWNRWCHFYSHWVVFSSLRGLTSQLNYTKVGPAVWLFQATLMGEWVLKKASFSKMQSAQGYLSDYLVSRLLPANWGDVSQVSCSRERPKWQKFVQRGVLLIWTTANGFFIIREYRDRWQISNIRGKEIVLLMQ